MNRLALQQQMLGTFDKSAAYSSYAFGDPATPLARSYLGDRVQFTVAVPALAETHTFHLHGHPWFAPTVGRTVDTWMLHPGDTHTFTAHVNINVIEMMPVAQSFAPLAVAREGG